MIHLIGKIPNKIYVACSGGPDSMAALDFLIRGKRDVTVLSFNHGTEFGDQAEEFLIKHCAIKDIKAHFGKITRSKYKNESPEEFWRNERYKFFFQFDDVPIVLAHHLNDAIETWLFSSMHGNPKLIPVQSGNLIRPFLITPKQELVDWCFRYDIPYLKDPSNKNLRYPRARIRHMIMPNVKMINPGIAKVIKKKYLRERKDLEKKKERCSSHNHR